MSGKCTYKNSLKINNSNLGICSKLQNEMASGIGDSNLCLYNEENQKPT